MRIVVCGTGPILYLRGAEALQVLGKAGQVLFPSAVGREMESRPADRPRAGPKEVRLTYRVLLCDNEQWRICFEWPDGSDGAENVEIVDYH